MSDEKQMGAPLLCHQCQRPQWRAGNLLAWRVYQAAATQFNLDFHVDVFRVMEVFGVADKPRMLAKLETIYRQHQKNQERLRGGTS